MDKPVIRSGPDCALLDGRFRHGEDGAVVFDAGVVLGNRATRRPLLRFVVAGQIGADHRPALPLVVRLEEPVTGDVKGVRIVGREKYREVPLESILQLRRAPAHRVIRPRIDVAELARSIIVTRDHVSV